MLTALKIILLLHCTRISTSNVLFQEIETYHNETYYKAEYAYEVVNKIYNAFRQWFFTVTFCEFTYFENRILKYTENMDYGYPVLLLNGCPNTNRTRSKPRINIHGQTAYVITSDSLTLQGSEYIVEALVRTGVFKPRSTVIFVINVPITKDNYFFYSMKNHFKLLWSRSITNSVVITLLDDKFWTFTYNFFTEQIIDVTDVKDIFRLLSHQYDNLNGHELRLSVYTKVFIEPTLPAACTSRLCLTVMKELNATCKAVLPRDGNTVGDLMPNGTSTGVTADLIDGFTDLELSSRILKNSYYGYIDTTYPLSQDDLCFMVASYDKQSTFSTVTKMISVTMLIIFMTNFLCLISIALVAREMEIRLWGLHENRSIGVTVLDLVKCFIRQTVDVKFPGFVYRFIIAIIINYSLVVNCVIDGIITSAITYPRYRDNINSLDELLRSNLTLAVHNRHIRLFNRSISENIHYDSFIKRVEFVNDVKKKEIIDERLFKYAVLMRKTDALYISRNIINKDNGRPVFHIVPECPVPCSIVYGLKYGSPYLNKLNDILNHLYQGGILQYWAKTEEYKGNQKLINVGNKDKPLNLRNLKEIFFVWFIGLFISVVVFFVEVCAHMHRNFVRHMHKVQRKTTKPIQKQN
ncbi:uncharacterized protein LOC135075937 [Ostrinia nubilalis]|uniref:uncharacterized protein LOC135075937 n=1 Tax=Ostrinia nubilalis TaxID=29057 RepID=UPI00308234A4